MLDSPNDPDYVFLHPMTSHPISVTEPVTQAIDRVKHLLFRPFDAGKWFAVGFCAWLAYLGTGGGTGLRVPGRNYGHGTSFRQVVERVRDYVQDNLYWIVPVGIAVLVLALLLGVVLAWLRSRGEFMFLHCVARNTAQVAGPWREFTREGNSLFGFRLVLMLVAIVLAWPVLIVGGIKIYGMYFEGDWTSRGILQCVGLGLFVIFVGIVQAIVGKLTSDFVVPIMFLRRKRCLEAWREFGGLLAAAPGEFIVYFLFQIVLAIAIFVLVLAVVLVTCCIAGCLLVLPYLGTVLFLPVLVFNRAYSLHYLAQFGPEYDVFAPPPAPPQLPPVPLAPQ
jgi:hypothetical protein